jgi:transposase
VRPPIDAERTRLEAGLRLNTAFVLRRCHILLASARGECPPQSAQAVGCSDQTVRTVIRAVAAQGIDACLTRRSNRPHRPRAKLDAVAHERLRALVHPSPRQFGQPTRVWALARVAEVSFAQGITPERVSDEAIRLALKRLGVSWKRATRWITSPDPAYARKKGRTTG